MKLAIDYGMSYEEIEFDSITITAQSIISQRRRNHRRADAPTTGASPGWQALA